jgi:acyl-CoA oxidase
LDHIHQSSLLSRYGSVTSAGEYVVADPSERMRIEVIGQRLLTGRLVIAEAALVGLRCLLSKTHAYCKQKKVNGLGDTKPALAALPQLRTLFDTAYASLDELEAFCAGVEVL